MVAARYGSLPVVYRTGGLSDTVHHLDMDADTGNEFVFETPDSNGLKWAVGESIRFFRAAAGKRWEQISRIMRESQVSFGAERVVERYLSLYENLAQGSIPSP